MTVTEACYVAECIYARDAADRRAPFREAHLARTVDAVVATCSVVTAVTVSVITYTPTRPFVVRCNEHGPLDSLIPPKRRRSRKNVRSVRERN